MDIKFDKESDYKFCENSYYNLLKGTCIALGIIDELKINEVIIDEYNTYHSNTPYKYNILVNVDGFVDTWEVYDEKKGEWDFHPPFKNEWIKIEFIVESYYRNPSDIFELMQYYPELSSDKIRWSNHEFCYIEALDNINEELSKICYDCLCDYAQARYEYEHDL